MLISDTRLRRLIAEALENTSTLSDELMTLIEQLFDHANDEWTLFDVARDVRHFNRVMI